MTIKHFFLIGLNLTVIINGQSANAQSVKVNRIKERKQQAETPVYPDKKIMLDSRVKETSGLFFWNDTLWTHNDNEVITFYAINPETGLVIDSIALDRPLAIDWEATTQDSNFLYLGDFGNNVSGIRTDLRIFKISKSSIRNRHPEVDTIEFNYPDQENFTNPTSSTDFDCEAVMLMNDSLYLFTKQWKSNQTKVYSLPTSKGKYRASYITTYNVEGLVTDVCYVAKYHTIVLTMYTEELQPYFLILNEFENNRFFEGNIEIIKVMMSFHQVEGIATNDGLHYYVSNEQFNYSFLNIQAQLSVFNLEKFIHTEGVNIDPLEKETYRIFPNPFNDQLKITHAGTSEEISYMMFNVHGCLIREGSIDDKENYIATSDLKSGTYFLHLSGMKYDNLFTIFKAR